MTKNVLLLMVVLSVCVSCGDLHPDYSGPLVNGYTIVRPDTHTVAIFAPDGHTEPINGQYGVAVAAKITRLNVSGGIIYGEVVSSPQSQLADAETVGFFLLDTRRHELKHSLTELELKRELSARGISTVSYRSPESFGSN